MPISGLVYDRIGPRWPTTVGLIIAAAGNYLLHTITLDTSRYQIMWLLMLQYAGLGIAMMPLFSSGLAVIPAWHANTASAFNNVVQRTAGAFGVAVCTAILTTQQAQLMAGRAALMPASTPTPDLGPAAPPGADLYATYQQADLRAFVGAIDNLFLIFAVLCALTALGALLMRSGPAPVMVAAPAHTASRPPSTNGQPATGRNLISSVTIAADNGGSARVSTEE
ncbi:MAG: hypothetical protein H0V41_02675 [Pseudonocardiales bacterium]|nr:hypothetical protein [Pseudonocardiales bacterium]